jgi:hypothetical protein
MTGILKRWGWGLLTTAALFGPAAARTAGWAITGLRASVDSAAQILTARFTIEGTGTARVYAELSPDDGLTFPIRLQSADATNQAPTGVEVETRWKYGADVLAAHPLAPGVAGYRLRIVAESGLAPSVESMVAAVDSVRMLDDLRFLTASFRHRTADPAHLDSCRQYIRRRLETLGYDVRLHTFDYQGYEGKNYLGRKSGTLSPKNVLVVDGHYDGVSVTPGADDNATAVAAVLEIARVLAPYKFKKTLEFAAFDLEEVALNGSGAYVQNGLLPGDVVDGALNLEMIGYYSDQPNSQQIPAGFDLLFPEATQQVNAQQRRGNFITNVANPQSKALQDSFTAAAARYVPQLRVINLNVAPTFYGVASDLLRSDHASFWFNQMPALMLTDGSNFRNPHYHRASDTIGTLNLSFMKQVTQATLATAAQWVEPSAADAAQAVSPPFDLPLPTAFRRVNPTIHDFKVYPNPFEREVRFEFRADVPWTLEITDAAGRLVHQLRGPVGFRSGVWNGRDRTDNPLPYGAYFAKLTAGQDAVTKILIAFPPHAHDH